MKYSLRSLMIVFTLGPPAFAGSYFVLAALNGDELQSLAVFGVTALVLLAPVVSAFRGEM